MIIIGYQGIGKSTTAAKNLRIIDLESSSFWIKNTLGGKYRDLNWYKEYVQVAEDLSRQGYIVFTSSHKEVRQALRGSAEKVCCVFPSIEIKDSWIDKLAKRYMSTKSEKDYKALKNAETMFEQNIIELKDECSRKYFSNYHMIKSDNYSLLDIVKLLYCVKNPEE